MAPPPFARSKRYTSRGKTKFYWLTTVTNPAAPTRAELNAGVDFTGEVADRDGWSSSTSPIETPDAGSRATTTVPGSITLEDSSFTVYMDEDGDDLRTLWQRDVTGFVAIMDGGDVVGKKFDLHGVTVSSVAKMREVGGDNADTMVVSFGQDIDPIVDITVPA